MIARIIAFSVRARWAVLFVTLVAGGVGVWQALLLPIDVTPDITNKQVQINTVIPNLTPVEVEKRVTYPIETALAGIPGLESTRSLSRNGFAQITAVFTDRTNIYFARQQVSERINEAKTSLPPGVDVKLPDNLTREEYGRRYFNQKIFEVWQRSGAQLRYANWEGIPFEIQTRIPDRIDPRGNNVSRH